MKYLFLIRVDPEVEPSEADTDVQPWLEEMHARGVRLIGERLRPAEEAKAVTLRGNETVVSEGPFTETKELIGGFDVIECADEAEALEIAAKHPVTRFGSVEVRACWPIGP